MSRDTIDLVRFWHPLLPVVVIGDRSQDIANDNPAQSESRLADQRVVRLDATEMRPLDSTDEGIREPRRLIAKRGLPGLWKAVVQCFIEGFALYGASLAPIEYRSPTRTQTRQPKPAQVATPADDYGAWQKRQ